MHTFRASIVFLLLASASITQPLVHTANAQTIDSVIGKHVASSLDEKLFLSINHYGARHPWLDEPMKGLSNSITYTLIGIPGALYLYGLHFDDRDEAVAGLSIAMSEAISGLTGQGLKSLIGRERPYKVLLDVRLPGTPAGGYSMPSGHATAAFALATSLSLHYPKLKVIIPSAIYAVGVALSRPYLGVHYPSDILAGAVLGGGVAWLLYHFEDEVMSQMEWALPTPGDGSTGQRMLLLPQFGEQGTGLTFTMQF